MNKDEENIINGQNGNTGGEGFSHTSNDQSKKEKSFQKNDLPSADDDEFEDGNFNSDIKGNKVDYNEDIEKESPEIDDDPEKMNEQVPKINAD